MEERGGVIGLLQREVEELKAALAGVDTQPSVPIDPDVPAVDPGLEQKLEMVRKMETLADSRGNFRLIRVPRVFLPTWLYK